MIDLKKLKSTVMRSDSLRSTRLGEVLADYPDTVSEEQYITLLPVILRLGR
jgi:hypothetical protein